MRYEYQSIPWMDTDEKKMTALGSLGWRVAFVIPAPSRQGQPVLLFERTVEEPDDRTINEVARAMEFAAGWDEAAVQGALSQ